MSSQLIRASDSRWTSVLTQLEHDVYHVPEYAQLNSGLGDEPLAFVHEDAGSVFLLPIIARRIPSSSFRDAVSPYGYPGPIFSLAPGRSIHEFLNESIRELRDELANNDIVSLFVRMHPYLSGAHDVYAEHGDLVTHGPTVSIDLRKSSEELWSDVRQNHRRGINKARRAGAEFCPDSTWESLDVFTELYESTMHRQSADDQYFFSREYFDFIRTKMNDVFHLLTVRQDERVISAGLFTECNGVVQYHLSGSLTESLPLQPLKLLLYESALWARARGNRWLHLGGGLGASQDSLYNFKLGFSKITNDFATWRIVCNSDEYNSLVSQWEVRSGIKADTGTGFFPPYRRPLDPIPGNL